MRWNPSGLAIKDKAALACEVVACVHPQCQTPKTIIDDADGLYRCRRQFDSKFFLILLVLAESSLVPLRR